MWIVIQTTGIKINRLEGTMIDLLMVLAARAGPDPNPGAKVVTMRLAITKAVTPTNIVKI
ncbi:hypothetical protein GCM10009087_45660 [Sphingomonas oligophenolica]